MKIAQNILMHAMKDAHSQMAMRAREIATGRADPSTLPPQDRERLLLLSVDHARMQSIAQSNDLATLRGEAALLEARAIFSGVENLRNAFLSASAPEDIAGEAGAHLIARMVEGLGRDFAGARLFGAKGAGAPPVIETAQDILQIARNADLPGASASERIAAISHAFLDEDGSYSSIVQGASAPLSAASMDDAAFRKAFLGASLAQMSLDLRDSADPAAREFAVAARDALSDALDAGVLLEARMGDEVAESRAMSQIASMRMSRDEADIARIGGVNLAQSALEIRMLENRTKLLYEVFSRISDLSLARIMRA